MQSQQKQLQIKKNQPINLNDANKQASIAKDESDQELQQKNDQIYIPQKCYKSLKKNKRTKVNRLHWTPKENHLYKEFLQQNINLLEADFHHRMASKINVLMSQHIETKSSNQCRSHHQKMMINHKDVTGIIKFIQRHQIPQSPLEIKLRRTEEQVLQDHTEHCYIQQINENAIEEESNHMIQNQHKVQLPELIVVGPQDDISQMKMQTNILNYEAQNISSYFYPDVFDFDWEI